MRSYREIPPGISPRQAAMEQRKRQSIIERARQDSAVLRRIEHDRCEDRARFKSLLCLWFILDKHLRNLETQRDEHVPITPDDPWDDMFCEAVENIPAIRRMCHDTWYAYANNDLI